MKQDSKKTQDKPASAKNKAEKPAERTKDLPVREEKADKVKGGARMR